MQEAVLQMTLTQTTQIKLLQCYTTPSHIMAHGQRWIFRGVERRGRLTLL